MKQEYLYLANIYASFEKISFRVLPPSGFPVSTTTVSTGETTSASPEKFSKDKLIVFQSYYPYVFLPGSIKPL